MRFLIALICTLLAAPVQALDYCDELWFTRNLAFDRAGYCFGSPLGKAIFDNEGCIGKDVTVEAWNKAVVDKVYAEEAGAACQVDSSRTSLDVESLELRKGLVEIPMPTDGESACLGYKGPNRRLTTAADLNSGGVGVLQTGDEALLLFERKGDYEFIIARQNFETTYVGWLNIKEYPLDCEGFAG